jgi:hypothetical protein
VPVGATAIVGALTVATLACLLRRWVVVFMAAVCSRRPATSSARPDAAFAPVRRPVLGQDAIPSWTSSGFPDTETQDPRRAGGRSPDRPQALTKPGLNRIGDRAVNAAGDLRQEVSDALGGGHEAGATRTPLAPEHQLGGVDGLDHLARGVTVPSPEEVDAAAGIAVVNVYRALRLLSVCWNSITDR